MQWLPGTLNPLLHFAKNTLHEIQKSLIITRIKDNFNSLVHIRLNKIVIVVIN